MEGGREIPYLRDEACADDCTAFIRCVFCGTH